MLLNGDKCQKVNDQLSARQRDFCWYGPWSGLQSGAGHGGQKYMNKPGPVPGTSNAAGACCASWGLGTVAVLVHSDDQADEILAL
jgi:hypothetical protein